MGVFIRVTLLICLLQSAVPFVCFSHASAYYDFSSRL
uniref:Uncharacterized protein n=1 Tax=Rhizophora mucronata TaxID=61149 RepID=A0A2P2NNH2_RHIMU